MVIFVSIFYYIKKNYNCVSEHQYIQNINVPVCYLAFMQVISAYYTAASRFLAGNLKEHDPVAH